MKKKIKKIVIKVGSSLIANYKTGSPKLNWMNSFINDLDYLLKKKIKIIIVSSGAIAIGRKKIGFLKKKLNLDEQQAAASVGQIYLVNNYKKAFNKKRVEIRGFGAFYTKDRQKRVGLNPQNGKNIEIDEKTHPKFRMGKILFKKLNSK